MNYARIKKKSMENNIWIRRSEEAHKKKNKVLMVGIVQVPPFRAPPSGDTESGVPFIWMFSVTDTTSSVCRWMKNVVY